MTEGVRTEMRWWGWGDHDGELRPEFLAHLTAELRLDQAQPARAVALEDVDLGHNLLNQADLASLRALLGPDHVHVDRLERVRHAAGRSYSDLLRLRTGRPLAAPDCVVMPADEAELVSLVALAVERHLALIPFGGGTSVVGGVTPLLGEQRAAVCVDLCRMATVRTVEPTAQIAAVGPGIRAGELEQALESSGLTLGHYPQSYEFATIGGYAATRSAGQASTGQGRFDELVVGLRCVTPAGLVVVTPRPPTAAGPQLRQLLLGSEGALGIISEVTLRLRRRPQVQWYEAWSFPSFEDGYSGLRGLIQERIVPDVTRLSDAEETAITLLMSGGGRAVSWLSSYLAHRGQRRPCLAILGFEGTPEEITLRRRGTALVLRQNMGIRLGRGIGESWRRHRFDAPYLRDPLMDRGVLVETLETAALWGDLHAVHREVNRALRDSLGAEGQPAPLVGCHLSHVYPEGASLYFTVMARQLSGHELEQWASAKQAATGAIVANGGTITHHHGVGTDHAAWLAAEIGQPGADLLVQIKRQLDRTGVMNPGKLLPLGSRDAAVSTG